MDKVYLQKCASLHAELRQLLINWLLDLNAQSKQYGNAERLKKTVENWLETFPNISSRARFADLLKATEVLGEIISDYLMLSEFEGQQNESFETPENTGFGDLACLIKKSFVSVREDIRIED